MTVRELMELLSEQSPDLQVQVMADCRTHSENICFCGRHDLYTSLRVHRDCYADAPVLQIDVL